MIESVAQLNELVRSSRLVEAIDAYYSDDVVMAESFTQSMTGKAANRERERAFVDGLTRWDATLHESVVDETRGSAFNRRTIHYSHKEFGEGTLRQIAAQTWRGGKVVAESFYKI